MALSSVRTIRRSRVSLAISAGLFAFGVSACEHTPLTAPSGSAITFVSAPAQMILGDAVTIEVLVLESKSAPTTTTNGTGNPNQGLTNNNNNNNTTQTAGGGTYVHDGTVVTFSSALGEFSPTEARTRLGHATVTFIASGDQLGDAKIVAISGEASQSHPLTIKSGGRP
jgi:hypothetical protein